MNFNINFNKTPKVATVILLFGYIVSIFALSIIAIEYIRLDFTAESLRFLSVGVFILLIGAYFNNKGE